MNPIYVTGHRNPDTDSIVAAMAYTALQNALGEWEYKAACLGEVSDETMRVLGRFGFEPPERLYDVHTQIRDLDFDRPPVLSAAVTVDRAWKELRAQHDGICVPVANTDGTLYGTLSRDNVASYHMGLVSSSYLRPVPIFNLLSVLEGELLQDNGGDSDMISGEVTVALPQRYDNLLFRSRDSIVVCGDQPDMIQRALMLNVNCLIICQAEFPPEMRNLNSATTVIITPFDAYKALRHIFQSVPVGRICRTEGLTCFHLDDRLDEVREQVLRHTEHGYPILDRDEKVVGILTRQHLLRPRRKRVVLVDHNEFSQSVPGLEEAEILAIIDHHRLADIQTTNPIYVRNEPVGSTNTIIAGMFQERGLMPSRDMAGIMAAAIVADTVMFKSPTCTERDRKMAQRLARAANVDLDELGRDIFSAALEHRSPEALIHSDYKEFQIAGYRLAVAQITCVNSQSLMNQKEEFLTEMRKIVAEKKFAMMILMMTDVLLEGSQLLYIGDDETIHQAFHVMPKDNALFLPHVMSRKKQIIPSLSALWG